MTMLPIDQWLGDWAGPNTLYYEGERRSDGTAAVRAAGPRRLVTIAYTWQYEGAPQEGVIVFPAALSERPARAALFDTWHTGSDLLVMAATAHAGGAAHLSGSYPAPPGPDWGWRVELSLPQPDALLMRMFNITPDGQEEIAVLAEYRRAGAG